MGQDPGSAATSESMDTAGGDTSRVGFDDTLGGHSYASFDERDIVLNIAANVGSVLGRVKAKTDLNRFAIGAGNGHRF